MKWYRTVETVEEYRNRRKVSRDLRVIFKSNRTLPRNNSSQPAIQTSTTVAPAPTEVQDIRYRTLDRSPQTIPSKTRKHTPIELDLDGNDSIEIALEWDRSERKRSYS